MSAAAVSGALTIIVHGPTIVLERAITPGDCTCASCVICLHDHHYTNDNNNSNNNINACQPGDCTCASCVICLHDHCNINTNHDYNNNACQPGLGYGLPVSTALLVIVHASVDCGCGQWHECYHLGESASSGFARSSWLCPLTQPHDWQDCAVHCCRHHSLYETLNPNENETLDPSSR